MKHGVNSQRTLQAHGDGWTQASGVWIIAWGLETHSVLPFYPYWIYIFCGAGRYFKILCFEGPRPLGRETLEWHCKSPRTRLTIISPLPSRVQATQVFAVLSKMSWTSSRTEYYWDLFHIPKPWGKLLSINMCVYVCVCNCMCVWFFSV